MDVQAIDGETGEASGFTVGSPGRRALHARLEWTGSGYIVAITSVSDDGTRGSLAPDEDSDPRTEIMVLDASGGIVERFDLSERNTMYPDIAWVGDRVAISWVETQADGRRFHMLDFVDCAE